MKKFNNLPVRLKVLSVVALMALVTCASYGVMLTMNGSQKTMGAMVDLAGRNRMLSQRIAALALLADTDDENIRNTLLEELRQAVVLHDQSLTVLRKGGIAPQMEGAVFIEPAPAYIVPKLDEIIDFYKGHKRVAEVLVGQPRKVPGGPAGVQVPNPKYVQAMDVLKRRSLNGTLLKLNIQLSELYTGHVARANATFYGVLVALFLFNLAVLAAAWWVLTQTLKPIVSLTEAVRVVADGAIPPALPVRSDDEIGRMAVHVNRLVQHLDSTVLFSKNVGGGDYGTTVPVFGGQGQLSAVLCQMRDSLRKNAEDDARRNWAADGIAKFADILRDGLELKPLCDRILAALVGYTGSVQGSIYLATNTGSSDETAELHLTASYAFDRRKFLHKTLLAGEGIVGQAFLERKYVHLNQVPAGMTLSAGLGEAPPSSLLVVPLCLNDSALGVLELASLGGYAPHQIHFVERLAENIAANVSSTRISEQTNRLLAETQEQAEMMKAQEEEMRQSMEELTSTQEEMIRKETEYLARIEHLESELTQFSEAAPVA